MSDEKNQDQRTPEEIEANVRKLNAEADFAEAQAEHKRLEIEAGRIELEAGERLNVLGRQQFAAEQAKDGAHRVYRFTDSVSAASAKACMAKLTEWHRVDPECDIEIVFSSPGGSIIDGMALFDHIQLLRNSGHKVTTGTVGMAASMAGILLQAGEHRWVGEQAWVLIHRASFGVAGSTYEVEDEVEFIKRIEKRIIGIFTKRSKLTERKIKSKWDRKDWWLTAEECLELGLVDEIRGSLA